MTPAVVMLTGVLLLALGFTFTMTSISSTPSFTLMLSLIVIVPASSLEFVDMKICLNIKSAATIFEAFSG